MMNKIPPEYRPLVYIAFAFILLVIFYLMFSPNQQCKRSYIGEGHDSHVAGRVCSLNTLW